VLVLDIERSDFAVIEAAVPGIAPGTFDDTPGFSDDPAPAPSAPLAEKLLRRLLSVFGFGAGLPASSPAELSAQIDQRWANLAAMRGQRAAGQATPAFGRIAVEGLVRTDGRAEWSYQRGGNGIPLPLPGNDATGATEFDRYVQNQVRLDLLRTLGS
jgi:hypothetical protein